MTDVDLLVCGAGPVGSTVARQAAELLGWKVLLVDRRPHLAGNCYDDHHKGVLVHRYGPHYFRTNSAALIQFLSRFTEWVEGNYIVKSFVNGRLYPFPINLLTLEQFFNRKFTAETAEQFLASVALKFPEPKNSEELVLSRVGVELYEAFFKGYTTKQWGIPPRALAPSVCGRIPIRFNRDCRYVDHEFQLTPKDGFTTLFQNMISHPNIRVMLNAEFREVQKVTVPKYATVYTGPIDEYFEHRLGRLPWRSLNFHLAHSEREFVQECVQVNYPNDFDFTRTVEIKHVTQQKTPNTVLSYEYSSATGEPFYPIPSADSAALYQRYKELAEEELRTRSVYFAGRLANYCYINTDQAIELGLSTFETLRENHTR